jgi:hypothetical protein
MLRQTKQDKTAMLTPTDLQRSEPAGWVSEMHMHFNQTGFYRAQDVRRVLGDQQQSVTIRPATDLPWASRVSKGAD